jgi:5'-3' exoribonuclease 2
MWIINKMPIFVESNTSLIQSNFRLTKHYVEGLCWVLLYYYQGCPSWTWYFPYHFAPFASDFEDISSFTITFDLGTPFKPAEQLMGVLPAGSKALLPKVFQNLMIDSDSPILDFYPEDFQIDMNGKKMLWQGVALLPFIDERRLLEAMKPLYQELNEIEKIRNEMGTDLLFVAVDNSLYDSFGETFYAMANGVEVILPFFSIFLLIYLVVTFKSTIIKTINWSCKKG